MFTHSDGKLGAPVGGLQGLGCFLLVSRNALITPLGTDPSQVWGQMLPALYKYPLVLCRLQTGRLVVYKVTFFLACHIYSAIITSNA